MTTPIKNQILIQIAVIENKLANIEGQLKRIEKHQEKYVATINYVKFISTSVASLFVWLSAITYNLITGGRK